MSSKYGFEIEPTPEELRQRWQTEENQRRAKRLAEIEEEKQRFLELLFLAQGFAAVIDYKVRDVLIDYGLSKAAGGDFVGVNYRPGGRWTHDYPTWEPTHVELEDYSHKPYVRDFPPDIHVYGSGMISIEYSAGSRGSFNNGSKEIKPDMIRIGEVLHDTFNLRTVIREYHSGISVSPGIPMSGGGGTISDSGSRLVTIKEFKAR